MVFPSTLFHFVTLTLHFSSHQPAALKLTCEYFWGGWKMRCSERRRRWSCTPWPGLTSVFKLRNAGTRGSGQREEKQMEKQKISVWRLGKRQTAWERAPDAVWEGYLIDDITPLSVFLSLLFSLFSFAKKHTCMSTHTLTLTRTVFALSPSYPWMTHRLRFSLLRHAHLGPLGDLFGL